MENTYMQYGQEKKSKKPLWGFLIALCVLSLGLLLYYQKGVEKNPVVQEPEAVELDMADMQYHKSSFASYKEYEVNVTPKVPKYEILPGLTNVINTDSFSFNKAEKDMLVKNGFFVEKGWATEFFPLYESNRSLYYPSFVTTDSLLHNYHLMFSYLLKKIEDKSLVPELKKLNKEMLSDALEQYEQSKGTEWEASAKRNVAFFAVGSKLADPTVVVPEIVKNEVAQELELIKSHQTVIKSPIMGIKEDYTQYITRGNYNRSEEVKQYFLSMMWYGRISFLTKEADTVKSAMLITLLVDKNKDSWEKIYEPVNFLVGESDDITYYDFKDLIGKTYGKMDIKTLIEEKDKFSVFHAAAKKMDPPKINSMPIFSESITTDREEAIKGFRFMGQRFTIDASVFQRLIHRDVEERLLPDGLDIPAAMGSEEALKILEEMGETKYKNYTQNMSMARDYLKEMPKSNWTNTLYSGWLYQLQPLLTKKGEGYPLFMQNDAWTRKELNTFLGSWSQLKHDTILYAKQVYAEMGGYFGEDIDTRGYVEPNPELYARVASLLQMTIDGLESRGLLESGIKETIVKMKDLTLSLKTISEKELNNEKLTDEEYELILSYGGQLEHLWLEFNKDEVGNDVQAYLNENNVATIADFATDPDGRVREAGVGRVNPIYVVFAIDGKPRIAKGGVYSYYEFNWPMSDRLTDEKWRKMLSEDNPPKNPDWTKAFMISNE